MKKRIQSFALFLMFLAGLLGSPLVLHAQSDYNLTVKSGPLRQSFEGFGVCSTSSWAGWDTTLREQMADLVYRDLKMNVIRFWITTATGTTANPPLVSPADMLTNFNTWYISSGFVNAVRNRGVSTFLLGPGTNQPPASVSDYANNIAELILQLKNTYSIQMDVTGIANEPGNWTPTQIAQCVNALRAGLDSRGLSYVKIIAPESSGSNRQDQLDAMLTDGTAWNSIYGIASHSYGPLGNHEYENRKLDKQWWITEAGAAGLPWPEYAENEEYATWILEIFLNNMNHGVTEWLHFNGPKQVPDFYTNPGDPTMLVMGDLKTRTVIPYLKYYYFKQALSVFDTGAIFRQCLSDTEGDMLRNTAGQNPAINASAAYNPDGSWGINIINTTGITEEYITAPTNLFYAETTYNLTLTIEELANTPSVDFTIYRSRANNHCVQSGTVTFVNGVGTVSITPRELVSLRSGSTALTIPPTPGNLKYSTVNDHLGLTWNNTVNATSWNVKRATVSGGPYTTIATTAKTYYDDTSAENGKLYYYVVSAINSLGESANSSEILATPAPFPWANTDIGTVAITGSCSVDDTPVFTTWGSGTNVGGTAESFNFTYVPISGTGTLIARIAQSCQANTKIGILMRETLGTAPKSTLLFYNFNGAWNRVQMYNRTVEGNSCAVSSSTVSGNPVWLKLVRSGSSVFTGYASLDGTSWTTISSITIPMANSIYAGMAVCACGTAQTIRAYFDNVAVAPIAPTEVKQLAAMPGQITLGWSAAYSATGYNIKRATVSGGPYTTIGSVTSPTLSYTDTTAVSGTAYYYVISATNNCGESANSQEFEPWSNIDLGSTGLSGSCVISSNGTFTIAGAGIGFGGNADSYNLTWKTLTGDGTLIARVTGVTNPLMGKMGLIMQETLATTPKAAVSCYDCHYQYLKARAFFRTTPDAYGSWSSSAITGLPVWLKLTRSGNVFTSFASIDGTTWTPITSATISMGTTIYAGLADTSRNTSQRTTATFDNVSLSTP